MGKLRWRQVTVLAGFAVMVTLSACGGSNAPTTNPGVDSGQGTSQVAGASSAGGRQMLKAVTAADCLTKKGYEPQTMAGSDASMPVASLQAALSDGDVAVVDIPQTEVVDAQFADEKDETPKVAPRVQAFYFDSQANATDYIVKLDAAADAFVSRTTETNDLGEKESRDTRPTTRANGTIAILKYDGVVTQQETDLQGCGVLERDASSEAPAQTPTVSLTPDEQVVAAALVSQLRKACIGAGPSADATVRRYLRSFTSLVKSKPDATFDDVHGMSDRISTEAKVTVAGIQQGPCAGPEAAALAAAVKKLP